MTLQRRNNIMALEDAMKEGVFGEPVEFELLHHFCNGVYARELRIPAGVLLTGKIHLEENLNILAKGTIAIATESGEKLMEAPAVIKSPAGVKRVGYALTDTVWITVLATDSTDPDEIEQRVTTDSYEKLPASLKMKAIEED